MTTCTKTAIIAKILEKDSQTSAKAEDTLATLLAIMASIPHMEEIQSK